MHIDRLELQDETRENTSHTHKINLVLALRRRHVRLFIVLRHGRIIRQQLEQSMQVVEQLGVCRVRSCWDGGRK